MSDTTTAQYAARIIDLEKALVDQKAITELAVKGLKEISWHCEKAEFNSLAGAGYFKDFIMDKADDIISEINKLTKK